MRIFFLFCFVVASAVAQADEYHFGSLVIDVSQSSDKGGARDGVIKVRGPKIKAEKEFKEMQAVGGSNGFFVPTRQPRKDIFLVAKLGDYNGRLLAVSLSGVISNLPLGETYADANHLLSIRESETDGDEFAMLDLKTMKMTREGSTLPQELKRETKNMKQLFPGSFHKSWKAISK